MVVGEILIYKEMDTTAPFTVLSDELRGGTLVKWLVRDGAQVKEDQPLLEYHAKVVTPGARPVVMQLRAPVMGVVSIPARPATGVAAAQPLSKVDVLATIRVCLHSMLFSGSLCAICASDVSKLPRRTRAFLDERHLNKRTELSTPQHPLGTAAAAAAPLQSRVPSAPSALAHNYAGMENFKVQHGFEISLSGDHVAATDTAQATRLRNARRLCLILDLDHTLVHATNDPRAARVYAAAASTTAGTREPPSSSATAAAVVSSTSELSGPRVYDTPGKSSHAAAAAAADCVLPGGPTPVEIHCFVDEMSSYYVKLRPGVHEFLAQASTMYELQVDTAGTRAYAQRVVSALDPSKTLFGNRIVSRCDSRIRHKQTSWLHRSLKDDSMVVIVDDTEAVWRGARNLLLIEPYKYWQETSEVHNAAGTSVVDVSSASASPSPLNSSSETTSAAAAAPASSSSIDFASSLIAASASDSIGVSYSLTTQLIRSSVSEVAANICIGNGGGSADNDDALGKLNGSVPAASSTTTSANGTLSSSSSTSTSSASNDVSLNDAAPPARVSEEEHAYLFDILAMLREIHTRYFAAVDALNPNPNLTSAAHTAPSHSTASNSTAGAASSVSASSSSAGHSSSVSVPASTSSSASGAHHPHAQYQYPRTDTIISDILRGILADACICFSGVFPLNCVIEKTPLWRRCIAFGCSMSASVNSTVAQSPSIIAGQTGTVSIGRAPTVAATAAAADDDSASTAAGGASAAAATASTTSAARPPNPLTTHLVTRRPGTVKFNEAVASKCVRVVALSWLEETLKRYAKQPESLHGIAPFESSAQVDNSTRVLALRAARGQTAAVAAGIHLLQHDDNDDDEQSSSRSSRQVHAAAAATPATTGQLDASDGGDFGDDLDDVSSTDSDDRGTHDDGDDEEEGGGLLDDDDDAAPRKRPKLDDGDASGSAGLR